MPEELESGEIDLAEILDGLETVQAKAISDVETLAAQHEHLCEAYENFSGGDATSSDIDAFLAEIGNLDAAGSMDPSFDQVRPVSSLPPDADASSRRDVEDTLARATNWRAELIAAATSPLDEQK